jgi:dynein heavy chain
VPTVHPDGDTSRKPLSNIYCELTNREKLVEISKRELASFNKRNPAKKMDIVLFEDALSHVIKIVRVITTPFGHALCVGIGGSGRKSLANLASSIVNFHVMSITITKKYNE